MQLQQINLGYDALHDRLLLRFSTDQAVEARVWLTRRLLKGLWPGLLHLMQATPLARQLPPEQRAAGVDFEHAQALSESHFGAPYAEQAPVLPGEPLLVHQVQLRTEGELHRLLFLPRSGPGYDLALTAQLLHGFARLLQEALKATDWDLQLRLPGTAAVATPPARTLN